MSCFYAYHESRMGITMFFFWRQFGVSHSNLQCIPLDGVLKIVYRVFRVFFFSASVSCTKTYTKCTILAKLTAKSLYRLSAHLRISSPLIQN